MAAPGERVFTPEELIVYNGTDLSKPLYICLRGVVFDVSASREFYGPGAAGGRGPPGTTVASRALAYDRIVDPLGRPLFAHAAT